MKTIIMAGGRGSRISKLFPDIPKPMILICGKPVLEWEIESLREQGFKEIILTVGYMANRIIDYFGDGQRFGVNIEYYVEDEPLGNAGALYKLRDKLDADFLLLNADAVFDIDFNRFVEFHRSKSALVSLFTHPNSHPYDSSLIVADDDKRVVSWLNKEDARPDYYKNRVNAGLHVISPAALDKAGIETVDSEHKVDLDRMILKPLCKDGGMYCYDSPEYVKDMGTPERFEQVSRDFARGVVKAKNLKYRQKAIFLDRDGTINRYVGFLREPDKFELLPGVDEAIRRINALGWLAIIATNQPVIARGEVTVGQLERIHEKMEVLLGRNGAYIDGLYYCPHHPHGGYEGEISEMKVDCECRKPKPGLLHRAASDFNIDLIASWMIGDSESDVRCGHAAGCKTALIGTSDFGQDLTVDNLLDAIVKICG